MQTGGSEMQLIDAVRDVFTDVRTIASGQGAGLRISARRADPNFARGTYEPALQDAIAANLAPGDVFYDIGANIGFFSLIAARRVGPGGHVYAFEPVPANVTSILRSVDLNRFAQIDVFGEAVGDATRPGQLLLAHHIGGATLDCVGAPPDLRGRIAIDVVAIDDIAGPRKLRPPQLVKVDVEGAEFEVLSGMTKTLRTHRPKVIYEVDDATRAGLERKADVIFTFLTGLDYTMTELPDAYPNADWHVVHFLAQPPLS